MPVCPEAGTYASLPYDHYFVFGGGVRVTPKISIERNHYLASVMSPDVPHTDFSDEFIHYYCILIDRDYFDSQYRLYTAEMPYFNDLQFALCSDILKTTQHVCL